MGAARPYRRLAAQRHAVTNDRAGISRAYVLRRREGDATELPAVLGFYTLSMAVIESVSIAEVLAMKLPMYPMPVALIGRLAVDQRAHGRRLGETLLLDALHRVVDAAGLVGCTGIIDAKDDGAERFSSATRRWSEVWFLRWPSWRIAA
jgi:hypothetical protein